jgi:hypothetical protein
MAMMAMRPAEMGGGRFVFAIADYAVTATTCPYEPSPEEQYQYMQACSRGNVAVDGVAGTTQQGSRSSSRFGELHETAGS